MPLTQKSSNRGRKVVAWLLVVVTALVLAGLALIYSGLYNVGADDPHLRPVYWMLDTLRSHSVEERAEGIKVPADLGSGERVTAGAGLYAEMCSGCHLAPGMEPTEIAQGLYPAAPVLARKSDLSPQEQFWIIKHGIKASGMAAWGKTHDDTLIWDMVAFLQKLPHLTPEQYREIVAAAPEDHDEMMEHADAGHDHSDHAH
jgi:mono/diheme cytochrome c family protein